MRQKRVKSYRKVMQLYQSSFKFREPYQLLVDSEFLSSITSQKLEFQARLSDVLQGAIKPMITQCCIQALYDLGPSGQAAVALAKEFERRKCNHLKARPEQECLTAMAGKDNPHRYVIATQSLPLRKSLRAIPGLPIVYINRSVVLLETPSDQTMKRKEQMETAKLHVSSVELASLAAQGSVPTPSNSTSLIDSYNASTSAPTPAPAPTSEEPTNKKKKRKGPSGPNPLSVKKKKAALPTMSGKRSRDTVEAGQAESSEARHDRKRRRDANEAVQVTSSARRGAERGVSAIAVAPTASGEGNDGADAGEKQGRKRKRSKRGSGSGAGAEQGDRVGQTNGGDHDDA